MSRPSMMIRPLVGLSSPAINLRTVLLPHPDGPTSTRSSPPAISSVRSRTATRPFEKVFVTCSSAIDTRLLPVRSTLHCASRESLDDPPLESGDDGDHGKRRQNGSRQNLPPGDLISSTK